MRARPATDRDLEGAEPLLERLDLAGEALLNLARLAGVDDAAFRRGDGWAAAVELDDSSVLLVARGDEWTILAPAGADVSDAMQAARRVHGRLGEQNEGWDLDR